MILYCTFVVHRERLYYVNKAHQNITKVIEEINLEKQLYDFDKAYNDFPLYIWAMKFVPCDVTSYFYVLY